MIGISIMQILGGMGLPLLLYMSAVMSIPAEVFDAARIDGASKFQRRIRIVFPMLVPVMFLVMLMSMTGPLFMLEAVLMMTGGGRGTSTLMVDIFKTGIQRSMIGLATARSMLAFVTVGVLLLFRGRLMKYVRREI